jgi:non-ribosomal peptide synthetase component F
MSQTETANSMLVGKIKRQLEGDTLLHRFFQRHCTPNGNDCDSNGVRFVDSGNFDEFISYQSLNLLSNAVARRLAEFCRLIDQDTNATKRSALTVVIDVEPSIHLVIGLLATLKLGLAYVPVDSRSTAIDRIKYILQVQ